MYPVAATEKEEGGRKVGGVMERRLWMGWDVDGKITDGSINRSLDASRATWQAGTIGRASCRVVRQPRFTFPRQTFLFAVDVGGAIT